MEAFRRRLARPIFRFRHEHHAPKERPPDEDLRGLRPSVRMAKEVGALLGGSPDLF